MRVFGGRGVAWVAGATGRGRGLGADDGRRTVDLTEVCERDLGRGALAGLLGAAAALLGALGCLGARVLTVKSMFPAVYLYGRMMLGWA